MELEKLIESMKAPTRAERIQLAILTTLMSIEENTKPKVEEVKVEEVKPKKSRKKVVKDNDV